jgi:adenosylhomocysteine nucleosidase
MMRRAQWCGSLRPGIVTGLAAEARLARRLGPALAGGGASAGAGAAAERLLAEGATALVSFGLCGGLAPTLRPGALLVPHYVLADSATFITDAGLAAALGGWSAEVLLAVAAPVATAEAKRVLFAQTGAVGIDVESGAVARVAARHGIPFAVLRAVCDPADMDLPPLALIALNGQGGLRPWRTAGELITRPAQLGGLIALARAAAAARAALVRRVGDIRRGGGRAMA